MAVHEDFTEKSRLSDVGRWCINQFVMKVAAELPPGTRVLDAGAGECAYQKLLSHCDYSSVDLAVGDSNWAYENLDYVAPLNQLPIADDSFDAVLCTQVLEHLEHPRECVKELARVLRPGGNLYLTAPMSHPEHQTPYDFFRYTSFGLRSIISEAGLEMISISPFGGIFTRWAYELPRALAVFPSAHSPSGGIAIPGLVLYPLKLLLLMAIRVTQVSLLLLDRLDKKKDDPFGWYLTAAKK